MQKKEEYSIWGEIKRILRDNHFIKEHPVLSKMMISALGGFVNTSLFHTPPTAVMTEIVNRLENARKPDFKLTPWHEIRYFNGLFSMNTATVLMVSGSITIKQYLTQKLESEGHQLSAGDNYLISVVSGMLAGLPASVLEGVAQAQQRQSKLHPPSIRQVLGQVHQHNGLFALTRGMSATALRSAGFTSGYLGMMPLVVDALKTRMGDTSLVYPISGILCGVVVAPLTAPLNLCQMYRKNRFDLPEPAPRYRDIIKKWYEDSQKNPNPLRSFALHACGGRQALIVRACATSAQFTFLFCYSRLVEELTHHQDYVAQAQQSLPKP